MFWVKQKYSQTFLEKKEYNHVMFKRSAWFLLPGCQLRDWKSQTLSPYTSVYHPKPAWPTAAMGGGRICCTRWGWPSPLSDRTKRWNPGRKKQGWMWSWQLNKEIAHLLHVKTLLEVRELPGESAAALNRKKKAREVKANSNWWGTISKWLGLS